MNRRKFIISSALLSGATFLLTKNLFSMIHQEGTNNTIMPALFVGHGSPMNAVYDNDFVKSLKSTGMKLQAYKPKALLIVSAHWLQRGTWVSTTPKPPLIYDFYGFPEEMYKITYPVPGAPEVAKQTAGMILSAKIKEDDIRGLDHGAWVILKHLFPAADVPVFQMAINIAEPPAFHFALGKELRELRKKGVMVIGSGNMVHNLSEIEREVDAKPYRWAEEFDTLLKQKIDERKFDELIDYESLSKTVERSIPTNDHYLPMLYALGMAEEKDRIEYIYEGFQHASVSMRSFVIGM